MGQGWTKKGVRPFTVTNWAAFCVCFDPNRCGETKVAIFFLDLVFSFLYIFEIFKIHLFQEQLLMFKK